MTLDSPLGVYLVSLPGIIFCGFIEMFETLHLQFFYICKDICYFYFLYIFTWFIKH